MSDDEITLDMVDTDLDLLLMELNVMATKESKPVVVSVCEAENITWIGIGKTAEEAIDNAISHLDDEQEILMMLEDIIRPYAVELGKFNIHLQGE